MHSYVVNSYHQLIFEKNILHSISRQNIKQYQFVVIVLHKHIILTLLKIYQKHKSKISIVIITYLLTMRSYILFSSVLLLAMSNNCLNYVPRILYLGVLINMWLSTASMSSQAKVFTAS